MGTVATVGSVVGSAAVGGGLGALAAEAVTYRMIRRTVEDHFVFEHGPMETRLSMSVAAPSKWIGASAGAAAGAVAAETQQQREH